MWGDLPEGYASGSAERCGRVGRKEVSRLKAPGRYNEQNLVSVRKDDCRFLLGGAINDQDG